MPGGKKPLKKNATASDAHVLKLISRNIKKDNLGRREVSYIGICRIKGETVLRIMKRKRFDQDRGLSLCRSFDNGFKQGRKVQKVGRCYTFESANCANVSGGDVKSVLFGTYQGQRNRKFAFSDFLIEFEDGKRMYESETRNGWELNWQEAIDSFREGFAFAMRRADARRR